MFRILLAALVWLLWLPVHAQTPVFINELHYDNDGTDTGEAVEIAGPAGTDLTGWSLVLYNGANGEAYATTNLTGPIPDVCDGFGVVVLSYPTNGIQNGAPDGLALVDDAGVVVQFLSYEGTFTAVDGPAAGMTSTDIGVAESGSTPVGHSLQLAGSGSVYEDFTWQAAAPNTFGACNTGQTFVDPCRDPGTAPFWDGTIDPLSGGRAEVPMTAGTGFAAFALDLSTSSNIALLEVRDGAGNPLVDYAGSGGITGSENSGFERFDFTGAPGEEATSVRLVIGAPEQGGSFFFLEVSDTCTPPRTLRVDPRLDLHDAAVSTEAAGLPDRYMLAPAYPNPFSAATTFRFALPETAPVRLAVFDVLGRRVAVVAEGVYPAGTHEVRWHAASLPGGVYVYRLETREGVRARRFVRVP
ncbi:T9SS type A sorting domain-containing protein [Rhodocaloribacter litoris]|uniref:T9SS type A sorting domain-containing protein n=1 Tax=Rhodocaloribacter litoris TaxID=2558931 RepID=UPI001E47F83B|nr:T9SS type A sorting domain-containing protein [Rhodocaloribacter litoris]